MKVYRFSRLLHGRGAFCAGFSLVELLTVIGIIAIVAALLLPVLLSARASARASACVSNQRQLGAALLLYTQDNDGKFPRGPGDGGSAPANSPVPESWDKLLLPYVKDTQVYRCPECTVPDIIARAPVLGLPWTVSHGYALNGHFYEWGAQTSPGVALSRVGFPATTVAFSEFSFRSTPYGSVESALYATHPDDERSTQSQAPGDTVSRFIGGPGATRHRGGSHYTFVDGHTKWHAPAQVRDSKQTNDGTAPAFSF